jgi:hypothetical protein
MRPRSVPNLTMVSTSLVVFSPQWSPSSRHSRIAPLFIPTLKNPMTGMTTTAHLSMQILPSLKFSPAKRARSSARSAGCAVLLSTITAFSPTRHFVFFPPSHTSRSLPLSGPFYLSHRLHSLISRKSPTTLSNNGVRITVQTQRSMARQRKVNFQTGRNRAETRVAHVTFVMWSVAPVLNKTVQYMQEKACHPVTILSLTADPRELSSSVSPQGADPSRMQALV